MDAIPQDPSQLDPKIVKVMSAIKKVESRGDYNAIGDNGQSHGAYQWNKGNFASQARQFGLDPSDMSPANQNKVAYARIKSLKDEGLQPEEIAAVWNGAKKVGNKYTYINPEYGDRFRAALKQGNNKSQGYNPKPYSNPETAGQFDFSGIPPVTTNNSQSDGSFIGDVGQTINNATTGIKDAYQHASSGQINPASGVLQGVGAIAGGVGGLAMNALEHTPIIGGIVKGAEGLVGKGIGTIAQTAPGQAAIEGINNFSQEHPEAAGNIGAGLNIAGLVGGGFGGAAAKDIAEQGIKSAVTKGFISAAKGGLGNTAAKAADTVAYKTASKLLESGPTMSSVKAAVKGGKTAGAEIVPDVFKGKSIQAVADLVKDGTLPRKIMSSDAAPIIKQAADSEAESMRQLIRSQDIQPTLQPETLREMADTVVKRAGESLVTGDKPAETLLKVFYDNLPKGRDIVAEDILNARQALYRFMEANKGDYSVRGVLTGYKSARNAIVDESRSLLKELAPHVDIEGSLAKQSALYQALDYIVPSVKKEVVAKAKGIAGKHPIIKGLVKMGSRALLEGAGVGSVLHAFGE